MKKLLLSLPIIGKILKSINNKIKSYIIKNVKREYDNIIIDIKREINNLENSILEHKELNNQNLFLLEDKLNILEDKIEDINSNNIYQLYQQLQQYKNTLLLNINKLDNLIEDAKKRLPSTFTNKELLEISSIKESKFNYLYKKFEDNFRGSTQEIKEQLKIYIPFVQKATNNNKLDILDIGCGRGEWLELLKSSGYNAKGIDTNQIMIQECKKLNLHVEQAEALKYLKKLPNNSLSVITGFHIIEHFKKFDDILELLNESYRVLKKGGIIIFETPNPRNILVSSSDFWLDPTHNKPIHPLTIKFFAKEIGFINVLALIKNNSVFIEVNEIDFDSLDKYVSIGRDYALIGEKP